MQSKMSIKLELKDKSESTPEIEAWLRKCEAIIKPRIELAQAKIGYEAATNAIYYMPKEVRPYTQETADRYLKEIERLEEIISCNQK